MDPTIVRPRPGKGKQIEQLSNDCQNNYANAIDTLSDKLSRQFFKQLEVAKTNRTSYARFF